MDFSTFKFRASSLPDLMTKSRSSDPLSETTKSALRELWIKEVYKREKFDTYSKFTDKGIIVESDSLDLVQTVTGQVYFKNKAQLENEFITGTPDVIFKAKDKAPVSVIDIKSSWDIWTFASVDEKVAQKNYYAQLLGYMWLTEAKQGDLIYCLVNTPEEIIANELYKLSFRFPEIGTSEEADAKYKRNYIFNDIEASKRMKKFTFQYDEKLVEELKEKIALARQYMSGLTL